MTHLKFENVSYNVDGKKLLSNINLDEPVSGLNVVLGANGAGKSLFLALCHGLIQPSLGAINWSGLPAKQSKSERSFVFQTPIIMRRSVGDNIAYPLKAAKHPSDKIAKSVQSALNAAQLTDLAKQPAANLSGGEAQRMAIARALITNPKVLLLDEPCSNLDPQSTQLIEKMLNSFVSQGGAVFMTTHDIRQAKRISDVAFFMDGGQMIEHKDATGFFASPASPQAKTFLNGA